MLIKRPRRLLLLGAGFEQIAAIKVAQELGYVVVAFDNQAAPAGAWYADEFHQVDLKDDRALLDAARSVAPDGVFCHAAELAVPVAKVAEALGLPGIEVQTAERATDKLKRVDLFARYGVPVPDFAIVSAHDPEAVWLAQFDRLGGRVVVKPPHLAGARGVELVKTDDQILSYRRRRGGVSAEDFLIESWTQGTQYSTESVLISGHVAHTAIALRHYDTTLHLHPHLIEDGHSMGVHLPGSVRSEIDSITEDCARALGLKNGSLKGDLVITEPGEIIVLEMAARTSGGRFADCVVPRATGVNILYPLIQMAMGDAPDRRYLRPRWSLGVSQRFFFPPPGALLTAAPELSLASERPGTLEVWFNRKLLLGEPVPEVRCHADRAGYVICSAITREDADLLALDITRHQHFETDLRTRDVA